jgi:hypothetical protein
LGGKRPVCGLAIFFLGGRPFSEKNGGRGGRPCDLVGAHRGRTGLFFRPTGSPIRKRPRGGAAMGVCLSTPRLCRLMEMEGGGGLGGNRKAAGLPRRLFPREAHRRPARRASPGWPIEGPAPTPGPRDVRAPCPLAHPGRIPKPLAPRPHATCMGCSSTPWGADGCWRGPAGRTQEGGHGGGAGGGSGGALRDLAPRLGVPGLETFWGAFVDFLQIS